MLKCFHNYSSCTNKSKPFVTVLTLFVKQHIYVYYIAVINKCKFFLNYNVFICCVVSLM